LPIKIFILSIFLISCANQSGDQSKSRSERMFNPCSAFKVRSAGNDVNLSYKRKFNYGPVYIGDTAYANLVFYTNSDEYSAANIVGQSTSRDFTFGDSFPGVNPSYGGCGYDLKPNSSCKINLQFKPNYDIPYSGLFIITFEVKGGICKQVIDLNGSGMKRL